MGNRSQAPKMKAIQHIALPNYDYKEYPNGLKLVVINSGVQEVFKIEVIFKAGRFHESTKLASNSTLRMLREGTQKFTSDDISETIDFYGATLSCPTNLDYSTIVLYGLNQHFNALLPVLKQVVTAPIFPEEEFNNFIEERKQQYQIDLSKNDIVAYRTITENIFGSHHPYGYNSSKELYEAITIEDLHQHYNDHFRAGNCTIILSGKIHEDMLKKIEQEFFVDIKDGHTTAQKHQVNPSLQQQQFIHKENAIQTAIRIGTRLFDRTHPDYFGLYFLNIIFGDYFSSRLMMNIREDKGYTYNIYSMVDIMKKDGMFLISTETANEYTSSTIQEIYKEMDRLKEEKIPQKELEMAKNYSLGTLLTALDGPFNVSEVVRGLVLNGLDETYFNQMISTLKDISSEELQFLARKYMRKDNMTTVLVGKQL